jgi:hypothetical protein
VIDKFDMLIDRLGRVFAGSAADNKGRGAARYLKIYQLVNLVVINAVISVRRNYRR